MSESRLHMHDGAGVASERRAERRQLAVLRAALIEIDGQTHFCRIVNVSSQGAELRLYRMAPTGSRIKIRFASELCVAGKIIWSRGTSTGIKLDERLDMIALGRLGKNDPRHRRRMPRALMNSYGRLRVGSGSHAASLYDISPAGARVKLSKPANGLGPAVLLLPDLAPIAARICWIDGLHVGLMFNTALEMQSLELWIDQNRGARRRSAPIPAKRGLAGA